jgi:BTB/POZ domain
LKQQADDEMQDASAASDSDAEESDLSEPPDVEDIDPNGDVVLVTSPPTEIRVSSSHLSVASPIFKALLSTGFAEGEAFKATGFIKISLPDDNTEAMVVLMKAIHGKFFQIPQALEFDTLKNVTVLIDKYDLHEAVYLLKRTWATVTLPDQMNPDDLEASVFIFYILGDDSRFKSATELWIRKAQKGFDTAEVSLPLLIRS